MRLDTILQGVRKLLIYVFILIITYPFCFVATCYRPEEGAIPTLKEFLTSNNISFAWGIHTNFYSQPNYYGDCGMLAMARVTLSPGAEPKTLIYKLHRSWFFGAWNIVGVSEYKRDAKGLKGNNEVGIDFWGRP